MIDKAAILNDLKERKLTQGQIAEKHGCSPSTIVRLVREYELGVGRGVKNYWQFTESSEALGYITGVYLTDGSVLSSYKTRLPRQFILRNTSLEYCQRTYECLDVLSLKPHWQSPIYASEERPERMPKYGVATFSSMFAAWLREVCQGKSRIPPFLFDAPLSHQVAFVCGAIDGDGHVAKNGGIRIRGIDSWLYQLPTLLERMNVRTTGCRVTEQLKSGRDYLMVSIRRTDFRSLNPFCAIPEKQSRLLYAVETRSRH